MFCVGRVDEFIGIDIVGFWIIFFLVGVRVGCGYCVVIGVCLIWGVEGLYMVEFGVVIFWVFIFW